MAIVNTINSYDLKVALQQFRRYRKEAAELDYMGDGGLAPASRAQRGYIHGLCAKCGVDEDDLPHNIKHLYDLTIAEASEVIETLKEMKQNMEFGISPRDYDDVPFF